MKIAILRRLATWRRNYFRMADGQARATKQDHFRIAWWGAFALILNVAFWTEVLR